MKASLLVFAVAVTASACVFSSAHPPADGDIDAAPDATTGDTGPDPCALVDCPDGLTCGPDGVCRDPGDCAPGESLCGETCRTTATDIEHCGRCDLNCGDHTPPNMHADGCADGSCQFGCDAGFIDANDNFTDGCEAECTDPMDEVCDGKDNDCDGEIDEGFDLLTVFRDGDGDGFGRESSKDERCAEQVGDGWVTEAGDCDDDEAGIAPNRPEQCDGLDTNCNPADDDAENPACTQVIFVTSDAYQGDFNVGGGADAICEQEAALLDPALAVWGSWRAVIFDGTSPAKQRVRQVGAVVDSARIPLWTAGTMWTEPPMALVNRHPNGPPWCPTETTCGLAHSQTVASRRRRRVSGFGLPKKAVRVAWDR